MTIGLWMGTRRLYFLLYIVILIKLQVGRIRFDPASLSRSNANNTPTWDMVKAFPMLDGKSFDDPTGKYYVGNEDVFLQRYWNE